MTNTNAMNEKAINNQLRDTMWWECDEGVMTNGKGNVLSIRESEATQIK